MAPNADSHKKRIVVLISGSGTNLQALIDAQSTLTLPNSEIVLVVSNRKNAYGLTRAANVKPAPIPTAYLALQPYLKANPGKTREDYDEDVARIVRAARPDLVVLAGWMHILSERFLDMMERDAEPVGEGTDQLEGPSNDKTMPSESLGKQCSLIPVINLHPALPGAFDGANAIERAYSAAQQGAITEAGVMVHRVIKEVDRGDPVAVKKLPLVKGESLGDFESRIHKAEWEVIVLAAAKVLGEEGESREETKRTAG